MMIRHVFYIIMLLFVTSCARHYNIAGNVVEGALQGETLYLMTHHEAQFTRRVDSCKIVHGQFTLMGSVDSITWAKLYLDQNMVMPLVIEGGEVEVVIDCFGNRIKGSPLNEKLNRFFEAMSKLQREWDAIYDRRIQLYMSGSHVPHILAELDAREQRLERKMEAVENKFIRDNFENVLGPGMFLLLSEQYSVPVITEQFRLILDDAPTEFLNHPMIVDYLRRANYKRVRTSSNSDDD